jgi:hypothetical protein
LYLVLSPIEIVAIQSTSRRFLALTRDNALWKTKCFEDSYQERRRLRQLQLAASDSRYAPLLQAMMSLAGPQAPTTAANPTAPNAEMQTHKLASKERMRALANWDPGYPDERIRYYEEYIHRHAPISTSWFETVREGVGEEKELREATGMGVLYGQGGIVAEKVIGALDDGSVGIWDLAQSVKQGRLSARTQSNFLTGVNIEGDREQSLTQSKAMMTETGAVECVSIDSSTKKGYFGVMNSVVEVDLNTLQITSREKYPAPVTAISEAKHPTPITVGTNLTLHLYDPRQSTISARTDSSIRCELIGGTPRYDFPRGLNNGFQRLFSGSIPNGHATLSQPGPLSILHLPEDREWDGNGSIWVAGRFTSLLNYDRRFFPRIRGTLHSGARISCLRALPHSFTPRELDLMRNSALSISAIQTAKSIPGHTLLIAGEYKGKGSLELYGLSPDPMYTSFSTDASRTRLQRTSFQNRQTASSSKLLSIAPHGGKLVYSDGDGNIKWVERDGFSPIRTWNINSTSPFADDSRNTLNYQNEEPVPDDIVQLLLPTRPQSTVEKYDGVGDDNLILWTGDGRLGLLGFGKEKWVCNDVEEEALQFEERSRRKEEKEYAGMMGRALRRQADELNFVRGFGLG